MAVTTCRSCGEPVDSDATTCPHCGTADPVAASAATPTPERETGTASRVSSAMKALGCLVIALVVLGIALMVGFFDILF